eukprot:5179604-Prymnesium_polylepis.1
MPPAPDVQDLSRNRAGAPTHPRAPTTPAPTVPTAATRPQALKTADDVLLLGEPRGSATLYPARLFRRNDPDALAMQQLAHDLINPPHPAHTAHCPPPAKPCAVTAAAADNGSRVASANASEEVAPPFAAVADVGLTAGAPASAGAQASCIAPIDLPPPRATTYGNSRENWDLDRHTSLSTVGPLIVPSVACGTERADGREGKGPASQRQLIGKVWGSAEGSRGS